MQVLRTSLRWVPWLMSSVLAGFLFDILGDQVGYVACLWAPAAMLCVPAAAALWQRCCRSRSSAPPASPAAAAWSKRGAKKGLELGDDSSSGSSADSSHVMIGTVNPMFAIDDAKHRLDSTVLEEVSRSSDNLEGGDNGTYSMRSSSREGSVSSIASTLPSNRTLFGSQLAAAPPPPAPHRAPKRPSELDMNSSF